MMHLRGYFYFLIFTLCLSSLAFSLNIDTNKLTKINTNSNESLYSSDTTNIVIKPIIEPELPNKYLSTGKIEFEPPETISRRYDLVFFISLPVAFYLCLNILQLKNAYFQGNRLGDKTDDNFMYFTALLAPMTVAYYDYKFMEEQKRIKREMASYYPINNKEMITFDITIFQTAF